MQSKRVVLPNPEITPRVEAKPLLPFNYEDHRIRFLELQERPYIQWTTIATTTLDDSSLEFLEDWLTEIGLCKLLSARTVSYKIPMLELISTLEVADGTTTFLLCNAYRSCSPDQLAHLMDLATSEELVCAVHDWPCSRYSDTKIESRRTTVWRYLVGEREPYTPSTSLSHRITIPFYRFLHILFNGTISVRTDDNRDLVTIIEMDLLWEIAEKVKLHPGYVGMKLLQQAATQKYIGHGPLITRLMQNFDCSTVYAGMLRPMSSGYVGSRALARNYVPRQVELRSCLPYSRAKELTDGLRCSITGMPEMTGAKRRMMAELGFVHILEPTNVTIHVDTKEIDWCISRIERHITEIADILKQKTLSSLVHWISAGGASGHGLQTLD